ncbi:MAG: outer membrane beta-barrel protein [Acidobacteriaceae bacterium]|nr:outer membrane beta-barrel protein [Acidobacteriaceae bacterium]
MKQASWLVLLIFVALLGQGRSAQAQIALYGAASANYLNNGPYTDFLEGGSAGILVDLGKTWHSRITLSADLQGDFVYNNSQANPPIPGFTAGEMYDAVTIGPRLTLAPRFYKLSPYVQGNLGFARYHDPVTRSITDNLVGAQAGVTRQITSRFDALVDYSYSYYGYNFGFYHPQTFSIGAMYHLTKR